MADIETVANLAEDAEDVRAFLQENAGHLDRDEDDGALWWLTMRPRSSPAERFYARVSWNVYPDSPPSVGFADGVGGRTGVTNAWPVVPGYRAPNDICKPFTAEGFALHSEWNSGPDAWPTEGNPFLWVAQVMQNDLDNHWGGRAG